MKKVSDNPTEFFHQKNIFVFSFSNPTKHKQLCNFLSLNPKRIKLNPIKRSPKEWYRFIFHNSIPVMIISTFGRQKTEPVRQQWADHNKDSTTMPADKRKQLLGRPTNMLTLSIHFQVLQIKCKITSIKVLWKENRGHPNVWKRKFPNFLPTMSSTQLK